MILPAKDGDASTEMNKHEFREICRKRFGNDREYGWKMRMSEITHTPRRTIQAWSDGQNKIPPIIAFLLRKLDGR